MPLINQQDSWNALFTEVKAEFDEIRKPSQYCHLYPLFYPTTFANPIANMAPQTEDSFVGTKVLHIMIVGYPYGWKKVAGNWTFEWPPENYSNLQNRIISNFPRWKKYGLYFFIDYNITNQVRDQSPAAGFAFEAMLAQTTSQLESECLGLMRPYGWQLKDTLYELPEPSYFLDIIKEFHNDSD